jgi:hypothetical protein
MRTIYISIFSIFLFSCGSRLRTPEGEVVELSSLKAWPDSLSITTYQGGGMLPEWDEVYISKDSCHLIHSRDLKDNHYCFKLSQNELDQLLKGLIDNRVEKLYIKKLDGIIYDKGSTSISFQLGHKFVNIGDGASEEIGEARRGDFSACFGLINGLADDKANDAKNDTLLLN